MLGDLHTSHAATPLPAPNTFGATHVYREAQIRADAPRGVHHVALPGTQDWTVTVTGHLHAACDVVDAWLAREMRWTADPS